MEEEENKLRELFFATIVIMVTVGIVIVSVSMFTEPFYQINDALKESANYSNNTELVSQLDDITAKTEMAWIAWPIIFIIGMVVWYFLWGQKWIYERY